MSAENTPLVSGSLPGASGPALRGFFFLGTSCTVTLNTLALGAGFFQPLLGPGVLASIGFSQFTCTTVAMLLVLVILSQSSPTVAIRLSEPLILVGFTYMLVLNLAMASFAMMDPAVGARVLYVSVAGNGLATGVAQGLAAYLAGKFSALSVVGGPSGSLLAGAGAGIVLPTIVQLLSLPVAIHSGSAAATLEVARAAFVASCVFSSAVLTVGVLFVPTLCRHPLLASIRRQPQNGSRGALSSRKLALRHGVSTDEEAALSEISPQTDHWSFDKLCWSGARAMLLKFYLTWLGVFAQALNMMAYVGALGLSPFLAAYLPSASGGFWKIYLPTVLLSGCNVLAFCGRALATRGPPEWHRTVRSRQTLVLLILWAVGFFAMVFWFVRSKGESVTPWWETSAPPVAIVIATFYFTAFSSGLTVVSLSEKCQNACAHSNRDLCPVTAQLNWFAIEVGSIVGIVIARGRV